MLEVLIALILLAVGYGLGRKSVRVTREPPSQGEQEQQRLREDRAAFNQLMGYSADRAYGLHEE